MGNLEVNPASVRKVEPQIILYPTISVEPIPPAINPTTALLTPQERAKMELKDLTGSLLDATFLQTFVVKTDKGNGEQYYLRISRPIDDITRLYDSSSEKLTMGYIRKNLGVKENVISANNDSRFSVDREKFIDSATLDKGRYIDIPVSELGQDSYFWQPWYCTSSESEALKAAVEKLGE